MRNYYEILEVSQNASNEVIEKAYKALAKKYHPDMQSQGVSDYKFKQIQEAYETLSDPDKKRDYDFKLKESLNNKNQYTNTAAGQIGRSYSTAFRKLIYNEKNKSSTERSKDIKALILTAIIMAIVIFICVKVPFIRNLFIPN